MLILEDNFDRQGYDPRKWRIEKGGNPDAAIIDNIYGKFGIINRA